MALLDARLSPWANRGRKKRAGLRLVLSAVLPLAGLDLAAQTGPAREYQVKAVYLYHFAEFVEWPAEAFPEQTSPLVIGVLGENPFGAYLDETVRGERVNNRPLVLEHYRRVEEIKTCHVLFISRSEAARLDPILARLKGRSILTVGDFDGFAQRGGIIRFVEEKSKIRFKINLAAAKAANLILSSKLLRPADIANPGKD